MSDVNLSRTASFISEPADKKLYKVGSDVAQIIVY